MRQIIGTLKTPSGQPLQSARIYFSAARSSPLGIPVGESAVFATDVNGAYDFEVEAGQYQVSIDGEGPRRTLAPSVTIAEGEPTDLMTLISAAALPDSEFDELYNQLLAAIANAGVLTVYNQFLWVEPGTNRIIELGPTQTGNGEAITYEVSGSINFTQNNNLITYSSEDEGQEIMTVFAQDESGHTAQVLIIVNVVAASSELTLDGVTVA